MNIERFSDRCTVYPDTDAIERVELLYDDGLCTIRFRDGTVSAFQRRWGTYHVAYYGLRFTPDGRRMFTGSWSDGVFALDTRSGETVWHYKCTKIRELFLCKDGVLALRVGKALCKLDRSTGALLGEVSGSALESCFPLNEQLVLLDGKYGKLCVVDTDSMTIVQKFAAAVYNPNRCSSLLIQDARLKDGEVLISGLEKYPDGRGDSEEAQAFERRIGKAEEK